jgi:predicted restriction endonuclease
MHARNPTIIEVAEQLGRTPSSIAMKLVNFASLDSEQKARGIRGLAGHSRADAQIWSEFSLDWGRMTMLSEAELQGLRERSAGKSNANMAPLLSKEDPRTEAERIVMVRTMQSFFRKAVLAAYDSRCCITGTPVRELLVASHILPWGDFPKERLNPRNGLCLTAHFDRAFDRGLISIDESRHLIVSPVLKSYLPNEAIELEFVRREGRPLLSPERFSPDVEFLEYHRNKIFRRSKKDRYGIA